MVLADERRPSPRMRSRLIEVDIEPLPAVADRHCVGARRSRCCSRSTGTNLAIKSHARARRRRRGVQGRALRPARELSRAAAHGAADGAARPARGMGRRARAAHRLRRRQGAVLQPPHAGEADGACRDAIETRRERRRRRLRRARRVLSGGFPHPVRGAPHRPAGEMDRGPPRAA